jgi:hypothetical protein
MSNYRDAKLKGKKILDDNLPLAWKTICKKLGTEGDDYHTISMHPKKTLKEKWFHASSNYQTVTIEKAKDPSKNSDVSMNYSIYYPEFEILASLYNDYVEGVSCNIRYTDSHMSSYVITLIAELL